MLVLSPLAEEHVLLIREKRKQGKLDRELERHEIEELEAERELAHHEVEVLMDELQR